MTAAAPDPFPPPPPQVTVSLMVNALVRTQDYRGDHAADTAVALAVSPDDTVADVIARAKMKDEHDWVELRVVTR